VTLDLDMEDGRVKAVAHEVRGCLLCQAAATVIGSHAPGETPAALQENAARLRQLIVAGPDGGEAPVWPELAAFEPVHRHKSRHECVLLPFLALTRALDQAGSP
jgi:nitrogen fixation NifU-like protein